MLNNFDRILQVLMLLMGIGMVLEPEFFAKQFKKTPILYRISYLLEEFVIQSIFKEKRGCYIHSLVRYNNYYRFWRYYINFC